MTARASLIERHRARGQQDPALFHRVEVASGDMLAGNLKELRLGLEPGHRVVSSALVLQDTVEP